MKHNPLVSIITTTRNEEIDLASLLNNLKKQTYASVEIIVIDNNSIDKTVAIAREYTPLVFTWGPERSAQRNYGAKRAHGAYYLFLDADMTLDSNVVAQCVEVTRKSRDIKAVIIPEKTTADGFWGKCKILERDCYMGDKTIEAARFFDKKVFWGLNGYDEELTGPEDWDLHQKVLKFHPVGRTRQCITHHEGYISLIELAQKKFYYGLRTARFLKNQSLQAISTQTIYILRPAFYRNWRLLLDNFPIAVGMFAMLIVEQCAGALGFLKGKLTS